MGSNKLLTYKVRSYSELLKTLMDIYPDVMEHTSGKLLDWEAYKEVVLFMGKVKKEIEKWEK